MGTSRMEGAKLHLRLPNSISASSMKLGVDLIHVDIIVSIYV